MPVRSCHGLFDRVSAAPTRESSSRSGVIEVIATARRPETLEDLDVAAASRARRRLRRVGAAARRARRARSTCSSTTPGFGVIGPVETVPLAEVRRMFETNVFGAVRMIQAVLPADARAGQRHDRERHVARGRRGRRRSTAFYSATKFALEALTEALHLEVGHFGIRVLSVEPGYIETEFGNNSKAYGEDEAPYDELAKIWDEAQTVISAPAARTEHADLVAARDCRRDREAPRRSGIGPQEPMPR